VGGDFTTLGGQIRSRLGRLLPTGGLDTSFAPAADDTVLGLAVQSDGKILAGGVFTTLAGQVRLYLGRLSSNGSAVPTPQIITPTFLGNGTFRFAFTNLAGATFNVLATTNVGLPASAWEVLGPAVSVGNGLHQFTDLAATNRVRRFYQLRAP
jgi:hypothetical protein